MNVHPPILESFPPVIVPVTFKLVATSKELLSVVASSTISVPPIVVLLVTLKELLSAVAPVTSNVPLRFVALPPTTSNVLLSVVALATTRLPLISVSPAFPTLKTERFEIELLRFNVKAQQV